MTSGGFPVIAGRQCQLGKWQLGIHRRVGRQSEQSRTLMEVLRSCVNIRQDDWVQYLSLLDFAYKDEPKASTGQTPFDVKPGLHPAS